MSPSSQRSEWEEDAPDTVRRASATVRVGAPRKSDERSRKNGRHRGGSSVPPSLTAHHGRAPEAASSTLRQNKAFLERLRRAAIRSDRPPPMTPAIMLSEDRPSDDEAPFELVRSSHRMSAGAIPVPSIALPTAPFASVAAPGMVEVTAQLPPARRAAARARQAERAHQSSRLRQRATLIAIVVTVLAAAIGIGYFDPSTESATKAPTGVVAR